MQRIGSSLAAFVIVVGCKGNSNSYERPKLSAEDQAVNAKLATELRARFEPLELERRAGLKAALAGEVVPRSDLGHCPIKVDLANPLDRKPGGFDLAKMESQLRAYIRVTVDRFPTAQEAVTLNGPLWGATLTALKRGETSSRESLTKEIATIEAPGYWDWDLVIVKLADDKAQKSDDGTFTGGNFRGRAFLWSFADHKMLCGAELDLQLSKIKYRESGSTDDFAVSAGVGLSFQVLKEARDKLLVVGPPKS